MGLLREVNQRRQMHGVCRDIIGELLKGLLHLFTLLQVGADIGALGQSLVARYRCNEISMVAVKVDEALSLLKQLCFAGRLCDKRGPCCIQRGHFTGNGLGSKVTLGDHVLGIVAKGLEHVEVGIDLLVKRPVLLDGDCKLAVISLLLVKGSLHAHSNPVPHLACVSKELLGGS
jgi:hypothetical protein